ncbi:zinc finger protein 250-like isoform X2 [Cheilinus undulatus]|nr:zinc finger protein 250-like isoform X2 [Cheilinus undulatus]
MVKEEALHEQEDWDSSPNQKNPLEEQEDLWGSQELQGAEEAATDMLTFTPVPVKSEEEKPQSPQCCENQDTEHLTTEASREDCGRSDPDQDFNPHCHLQTVSTDEISQLSGSDTDDSGDLEESDEPRESFNTLLNEMDCAPSSGQNQKHKGIQTEERPYSCSDCSKRFRGKKHLQQHMLRHSVEKPFSCSVCGKSFNYRKEIVTHMRVHTGEKPYSCSFCGKEFSLQENLRRHSIIHTGEKPFSCSMCCKRFSQHGHLIQHSVVHTGEKPFCCTVCGKGFSLRGNLRTHSIIHTGEKPFSCLVCGHGYTTNGSLKRHNCSKKAEPSFYDPENDKCVHESSRNK